MSAQGDPRACPQCREQGAVQASRYRASLAVVWRSHRCAGCGHTWTTFQLHEAEYQAWRSVRFTLRRLRGVFAALGRWLE